ncbi:MAG TPA: FAD-binding oxidoreductase, partial [Gammaproteobacteria bacterium]|nr:FAD-binding oxidoreductase [Gammaproteobacteria bacterium]
DPADTLQDLITASRDRGVEVRFRTGVNSVLVEGDKVSGIELDSGTQIHSRSVVNAAGPWCNHFFEELGLENPWPLVATRVQILHLDRPEEIIGTLPVCVDLLGGIYFRTQNQGQQIILGSILEEDEQEVVTQPDEFDRMVDDIFTQTKLHALHHRLPSLPYKGKVGGYSGLYTTNLTDVHPIVGQTPIDGFFVANGFSGHGFKLGPAIGSLLAQAITGQQSTDFDTSVDSEFLAFDRLPIQVDSKSVLA